MVKNPPASARDAGSIPGLAVSPGGGYGNPLQYSFFFFTPVFLPEDSHGLRSLVGYSPWGHKRVGYNLATKQQQQRND